jgi:hypothetical protein
VGLVDQHVNILSFNILNVADHIKFIC